MKSIILSIINNSINFSIIILLVAVAVVVVVDYTRIHQDLLKEKKIIINYYCHKNNCNRGIAYS